MERASGADGPFGGLPPGFERVKLSSACLRMDNRQLYATVARDEWVNRTELIATEAFLVSRFLDPRRSTVEAGTGGGRILFELQRLGFTDLHGFDYVPAMIEAARRRDRTDSISFTVQSAVDLDYPDGSFDQALYLQQIVSFIEQAQGRTAALREARRILRPGGTALFSFLCFEARMKNPGYAAFARYLRVNRRFSRTSESVQSQPWLRHGPRRNWRALLDDPPYVYWYRIAEAVESVRRAGFQVVAVGSHAQLEEGRILTDPEQLTAGNVEGMMYLVATAA